MRVPLLFALAAVACGAPALRGGETAPPGREPPGRCVASYRTAACIDRDRGKLDHPVRVYLVEDASRKRMLVVARPSYDSLVIRAPAAEGTERVFQVIVEGGDGGRVLHDFRLPASGRGDGRMAVSTEFSEAPTEPTKVSAKVTRVAIACRLTPDEAAQ